MIVPLLPFLCSILIYQTLIITFVVVIAVDAIVACTIIIFRASCVDVCVRDVHVLNVAAVVVIIIITM